MIKNDHNSHRRYVFPDLLRVLACAVVVGYHFFKEARVLNLTSFADPDDVLQIGNVHPVMIAVSVFFMISGIGLAVKMGREEAVGEKPDWKAYYLGRFRTILIPFYIAWILWAIYKLISVGIGAFAGIDANSILCTLFGADTFAQLYIPVFSLHIGEWFLGALVILYVFFPVFYTLFRRHYILTLAAAVIGFAVVVLTYNSAMPWHMNILARMFCFVFGIAIGMRSEFFDDPPKWVWAVPLLIIGAALKIPPCFSDMMVTIGLLAIMILLEKNMCRCGWLCRFLVWASGVTYYIFLTHHVIIQEINMQLFGHYFNKCQTWLYFIAEFAIAFAAAMLVKLLYAFVLKLIRYVHRNGN